MADAGPWPRIMVVTDRGRLVSEAGAALDDWPVLLQAQIAGALSGGADLIQVREPDVDARTLVRTLRAVFTKVPDSARHVTVNDRADVSLVTGAAGVHLAERSIRVGEARTLQPAGTLWVIGRSVHDEGGAAAARDADYIVAGTVQASLSKPDGRRLLGWKGLSAIVRAAGTVPVMAIGGLGPQHVQEIVHAGAVGLAGIGCFLPIRGEDVAASVRERVRAVRTAFDRT
jgi:thiamine-phosphate pyrophosphorylase